MMREVTLYTIEEQTVMCAGDYVSFFRTHGIPSFDEFIKATDGALLMTTDKINAPVRRFHETVRDAGAHEVRTVESYIAIDPKLERMVAQPHIDKMEWALKQKQSAMCQLMLYQDRISEYNDLPWYKRIFRRV